MPIQHASRAALRRRRAVAVSLTARVGVGRDVAALLAATAPNPESTNVANRLSRRHFGGRPERPIEPERALLSEPANRRVREWGMTVQSSELFEEPCGVRPECFDQ